MQVHEIMSTPVVGVLANARIEEAINVMLDRGYTTLPVFSDTRQLIGLITETDLGIARLLRQRTSATPEDGVLLEHLSRHVRSAMRPPLAVPANAELDELATLLLRSQVRSVPVLDGDQVVGMVSWRDVLGKLTGTSPTPARHTEAPA